MNHRDRRSLWLNVFPHLDSARNPATMIALRILSVYFAASAVSAAAQEPFTPDERGASAVVAHADAAGVQGARHSAASGAPQSP